MGGRLVHAGEGETRQRDVPPWKPRDKERRSSPMATRTVHFTSPTPNHTVGADLGAVAEGAGQETRQEDGRMGAQQAEQRTCPVKPEPGGTRR